MGHRYPNAGHLEFSSHATIFNRLPTDNNVQESSPSQPVPVTPDSILLSNRSSNQQLQVLEEVFETIDGDSFKNLINFWLEKRIVLALGGPFVETCTQTLQQLLAGKLFDGTSLAAISQKISENSARPLEVPSTSALKDLHNECSNTNVRWETLALALIVAGRATTDISFFPPLYTCRPELRVFQQSVTDLSDKCLEIALSFDSLNDIQLICQYESFILHSVVDGDQSKLVIHFRSSCIYSNRGTGYNAWRRLGDVISSMLFLGLNEKIEDNPTIPLFLTELRRSAFAQIYSDDKNVAVFLGRPPRLNRKFCCFQLPSASRNEACRNSTPGRPMANESYAFFGSDDQLDQVTSLRWTACCASLKEEILEALQEHDEQLDSRAQRFT